MNPSRRSAVCSFLLAACLPAAAEDLTLVQTLTRDDSPPTTATSYVSSDRLRMVSADGNEVLVELGAGKFTVIDNRKGEYYVVTKQQWQTAVATMQARRSPMDQMQPQQEPPQLREAMSRRREECLSTDLQFPEQVWKTYQDFANGMGAMAGLMVGMATTVDIQKGTGSRTIAGYRCDNWTITIMATGPMGQVFAQMKKIKNMKGFPLASTATVTLMGHSGFSSTEVTGIKRGPIPATAWQIPAGYKQTESPLAKSYLY